MSWPEEERWTTCWQSVGATGDPRGWYARLALAYAEPHRHYHNGAAHRGAPHGIRPRPISRATTRSVELPLWFHDAVYNPKASDNEEQSAELAACCLAHATLPNAFIECVRKVVMATKRHEAEPDSDEAVMVDVDLSILGHQIEKLVAMTVDPLAFEQASLSQFGVVFLDKRQFDIVQMLGEE